VDGDRVYAVTDVIKVSHSGINEDCEDAEELDEVDVDTGTNRQVLARPSSVSRRMIEQFFTEIEGPDRDWQYEDYDMYEDRDRPELIM
jgi:hypothetical protein